MKTFLLSLLALIFWGQNFLSSQDYDPCKDLFAPEILEEPSYSASRISDRGREWRAFWADAWNKGIFNSAQVKEMVEIASRYGYNAIVVQVRRRGDAIYFPVYPNTEPRMPGLDKNFDALQEVITRAHAVGIEVHAWITTFLISTPTPPSDPQHVYHRHPEYLTENSFGEKKIAEGYYLDPGHPQALEWNTRVVMDLVTRYEIDGIHFDYVRYPLQDSGYNPVAIARYNKEFQTTGKPTCSDPKFSAWRRRQITDWLRNIYVQIVGIKPSIKITAATFAGRSDAYHNRFQDWALWMQEGILDANLPMNYTQDFQIFKERVDDLVLNSYGRHVYMGVGAYLLDVEQTISQLQYARASKCSGVLLFSYANNAKSGDWLTNFQTIHRRVFETPAVVPEMPWKTNPTFGFLRGKVVSSQDGLPIYNASVLIPMLQKSIKTDAQGWFSITGIPAGEYIVQCQKDGFKVKETKVAIKAGKVSLQNFSLEAGDITVLILDTGDAEFVGNWTRGTSATDKYGTDYRFIGPGDGHSRAIFQFPQGINGSYRLFTWYSVGSNRTTTARYEVYHTGGMEKVIVNQQKDGGRWNLLGTWNFSSYSNSGVHISDYFQTGNVVIADAVKIEKAN